MKISDDTDIHDYGIIDKTNPNKRNAFKINVQYSSMIWWYFYMVIFLCITKEDSRVVVNKGAHSSF